MSRRPDSLGRFLAKRRTWLRSQVLRNPTDGSVPVEAVDNTQAPKLIGTGYYFTTPSGKTVVHHPRAYRWPVVYHPSTFTVTVGAEWLRRNDPWTLAVELELMLQCPVR